MRDPELRAIALDCLKLAAETTPSPADETVERAERYFAFVTGEPIPDADAK